MGAFVDVRDVRLNTMLHQTFQRSSIAIGGVSGEAFGFNFKALRHPLHHGQGGPVLVNTVGPVTLGIDDYAELVVDQIVGVIGEGGSGH